MDCGSPLEKQLRSYKLLNYADPAKENSAQLISPAIGGQLVSSTVSTEDISGVRQTKHVDIDEESEELDEDGRFSPTPNTAYYGKIRASAIEEEMRDVSIYSDGSSALELVGQPTRGDVVVSGVTNEGGTLRDTLTIGMAGEGSLRVYNVLSEGYLCIGPSSRCSIDAYNIKSEDDCTVGYQSKGDIHLQNPDVGGDLIVGAYNQQGAIRVEGERVANKTYVRDSP